MRTRELTDAGVLALARLFPGWRIWADQAGFHASRRGAFRQDYEHDAPAFAVHAYSLIEMAGQLRWQKALDEYSPSCTRRLAWRGRRGPVDHGGQSSADITCLTRV